MLPQGAIGRLRRLNAGPLLFVWGMWLIFSFYLLGFVRTYSVDFPYYDEWENVAALTGQQPITLQWLWSLHNEHRIFLPRLIYLAIESIAGYDFRAVALFNACVLSASAAALIGVAHRLRGRPTYADAFVPLIMLHWGQAENLLLSFQIQFVGSSVLAIIVLLLLVDPGRMSFRAAMALGACTILFPLFGGNGVALGPALVVCVFLVGWELRNAEDGGKWRVLGVWTLGLLAIGLTAFYFVEYERPAKHPASTSLGATLNGAIQFLTMGFGAGTRTSWPLTEYALLAVFGATVAALVVTVAARSRGGPAALRLLLFLGSLCSLALGISWARSAFSPAMMFSSRYATLAAPFCCAIYLAWESVDRPLLRRFAQLSLFFSAAAFLVANREVGIREGILYRDLRANVIADIHAGIPLGELLNRHYPKLYYGGADVLAARMRLLHAQGIGIFKELKE